MTLRLFALAATIALAQAQHHDHSEKPVTLLSGLGPWRHPISTTNPEAQKFFDQGLNLVYGFNRYEALRAFRKASELDPSAPMPHWGASMALGPYVNMDGDPTVQMKESCEAADAGLRLAAPNSTDRAWLEAAKSRCPDFADPSRYIAAMRQLAQTMPDDPDAQTFFAESLMIPVRWKWYRNGKPAEGVEEAERVLRGVILRFPQHPGANHYYIHAVESSPTPERGVPSAQRLMGIVPAAGHMVHMPGHIWLALGDFDNTVAVNERAVEVDRKYFAETGVSGAYEMYYLHNLDFLLYARTMQGRSADSKKVIADFATALEPMRNSEMAEMADVFGTLVGLFQIRLREWDALLAATKPKSDLAAAFWHYSRAFAYHAKHDELKARAEQSAFETLAKSLPKDIPWSTNKLGDVIEFADAALAARLETSPKSIPMWKHAVDLQDALIYDEPPAWYYPLRESLGAALLLSGDAPAAEEVFREGLRRSPNNGRMLFGLLESLTAQEKTEAAKWVRQQFESSWRGADTKLALKDF